MARQPGVDEPLATVRGSQADEGSLLRPGGRRDVARPRRPTRHCRPRVGCRSRRPHRERSLPRRHAARPCRRPPAAPPRSARRLAVVTSAVTSAARARLSTEPGGSSTRSLAVSRAAARAPRASQPARGSRSIAGLGLAGADEALDGLVDRLAHEPAAAQLADDAEALVLAGAMILPAVTGPIPGSDSSSDWPARLRSMRPSRRRPHAVATGGRYRAPARAPWRRPRAAVPGSATGSRRPGRLAARTRRLPRWRHRRDHPAGGGAGRVGHRAGDIDHDAPLRVVRAPSARQATSGRHRRPAAVPWRPSATVSRADEHDGGEGAPAASPPRAVSRSTSQARRSDGPGPGCRGRCPRGGRGRRSR